MSRRRTRWSGWHLLAFWATWFAVASGITWLVLGAAAWRALGAGTPLGTAAVARQLPTWAVPVLAGLWSVPALVAPGWAWRRLGARSGRPHPPLPSR